MSAAKSTTSGAEPDTAPGVWQPQAPPLSFSPPTGEPVSTGDEESGKVPVSVPDPLSGVGSLPASAPGPVSATGPVSGTGSEPASASASGSPASAQVEPLHPKGQVVFDSAGHAAPAPGQLAAAVRVEPVQLGARQDVPAG